MNNCSILDKAKLPHLKLMKATQRKQSIYLTRQKFKLLYVKTINKK